MFQSWNWLEDPKTGVKNLPKSGRTVLIRTIDNEIVVATFRKESESFTRAQYTGNLRFSPFTLSHVLQWHLIPGDEG